MRKILKFLAILFLGVITCACVNSAAVQELNKKAAEYLESGDVDAAIARLESSIDLDDKVYESRYNLAVSYMRKKNCEKANEHIKIALELAPKEPAVYYTHAVSAMCLSAKIFEKENKEGVIEPVVFNSKQEEEKANEKYIALLKEANASFDMYTKLAPTAEDTQSVIQSIRENNQIIEQKSGEISKDEIE